MDNPLWLYSIEQYQKPGCAKFLLQAQDKYGLDVNILLFIGWLNLQAKSYYESRQLRLVHDWQLNKVRPIRQLRRQTKALQHEPFYQAFKDLELKAEKCQQQMLFNIGKNWAITDQTGLDGFKSSLQNYCAGKIELEESWLQVLYQHLQP
jgi:uncharacterized protein (TIGR02444 family)